MADRASITAKKAKTRTASVLLPERTVDSLFAYETLTAAPHALIWSPPNSTPDEHGLKPDHVVTPDLNPGLPLEQHRRLVFECKTIYGDDAHPGGWHIRIPRWQLDEYVQVAPQTLYLLPSHEPSVQPWWRYRCCAGANATCYSCRRPEDRRWAAGKNRGGWGHLPWYIGFQPWFSHWAWCVSARNLKAHLDQGRKLVKKTTVHNLDAKDTSLSEIPGAERFCHLLTAIGFDAAGHRWFEGRVEEMEAFYTREERAQVLLQESFVENFADLPTPEAGASDTPPRRALLSYARHQPDDAE